MTNPYESPRYSEDQAPERERHGLRDLGIAFLTLGALTMQPLLYNLRIPVEFSGLREATMLLPYLPVILLAIYLGWRATGKRTVGSISKHSDTV